MDPMPSSPTLRRAIAAAIAFTLVIAACSDDTDGASVDLGDATTAEFSTKAGVHQVTVTGATPQHSLQVIDDSDEPVEALFTPGAARKPNGVVDEAGNLVFGRLDPGTYRVIDASASSPAISDPVDVLDVDDHPDQSLYDDQTLEEGVNYLEMRDGTTLAAMVRFPDTPLPGTPEGGPYPTLVEYSGYDPSNPGSPQPSTAFANGYGFATVGVNVRGTACSGGALSYFESDQVADGYDVIETVGAQDWVQDNEVGMVGLSYPGISQLFVAQTQPPSLAAIAPLSVIGDVYRGTTFPGGIYNNGFVAEWSNSVGERAEPGGYEFVAERIAEGDEVCEANQALRTQNLDLVKSANNHPTLEAKIYEPLSPAEFADKIDVPVFLSGEWQDEQVGGYVHSLFEALEDNDDVWITMVNGAHGDGFTPQISQRWTEFLDLFVAKRIPEIPPVARALIPGAINPTFGGPLAFGPDRLADADSYEDALEQFREDPRFTLLMEAGATDPTNPGLAEPTFAIPLDTWPAPEAEPTTWYLQPGGVLDTVEPSVSDEDEGALVSYDQDPGQADEVTLPGDSVNAAFEALPPYQWNQPDEGSLLAWTTEPLDEDITLVGTSRADLWVASTATDTDLEVTITEVRADGTEFLVQTGWQRASMRALDDELSTDIRPVPTFDAEDQEALEPGELTEVSVEIFPVAHVFRAGSSIRMTVDSPGDSRARWKFQTIESDGATNTVATSAEHPSRITMPFMAVDAPPEFPACPSLRGQPCRQLEPVENTPAEDSDAADAA
jgi:predicted acyl esterase